MTPSYTTPSVFAARFDRAPVVEATERGPRLEANARVGVAGRRAQAVVDTRVVERRERPCGA